MTESRDKDHIERAAAVITWAVVGALAIYVTYLSESLRPRLIYLVPLLFVYLGLMWLAFRSPDTPTPLQRRLFVVQLLIAFAMGVAVPANFLPIYTIIWIATAPSFYSIRVCFIWLGITTLVWFLLPYWVWSIQSAAFNALLFGTFHLFALLSARNALAAKRARENAETLNRQLLSAQHLLASASRQSERLRIARDLHDTLGHHLTALSLQLQIAERRSASEARDEIAAARGLTRLLLSDIRDTVSALRTEDSVDLDQLLHDITDGVPGLKIELKIDDALHVPDVAMAEAIVRVVQESITNALKHAHASTMTIAVSGNGETVRGHIKDDGRGSPSLVEGHGITGMRERLAQFGGRLTLEAGASGMSVRFVIPKDAGA